MSLRPVIIGFLAVFALSAPALSEEQMRVQAASGSWVAYIHQPSMVAPADVCLAVQTDAGFAFRAGPDGVQLRVMNREWSLPAHVTGKITVKVGDLAQSYGIDFNDDTMVSASLGIFQIMTLLDAMDRASVMVVGAGKGAPVTASLAGSTKVTNAFRACAGLGGMGAKKAAPGANPFDDD